MRRAVNIIILTALTTCRFAIASPPLTQNGDSRAVSFARELSVQSAILEESRRILVALPEDHEERDQEYPVVFLLGGHIPARLMLLRATTTILAEQGKVPDCIIVGIDTRSGYAKNLFPTKVDGWPDSGGADSFLRFISEELIPFVEGHFKAAPYRVLVGQSNSGLTTLHALFANSVPAGGFIGCSPTVGWCSEFMTGAIRALETPSQPTGRRLYVAYGNDDFPKVVVGGAEAIEKALGGLSSSAFHWTIDEIAGGGHVPVDCFRRGLMSVFPDWEATPDLYEESGLEGVQAHYTNLSTRYGFRVRASATLLDEIGTRLMAAEKWNQALEVFDYWAVEQPDSARPRFFAAVAHYRTGDHESAASLCRSALDLDDTFKHAKDLLSKIESASVPGQTIQTILSHCHHLE